MKYKAEIVKNGIVFKQLYYDKLTHPNQVVRNVVQTMIGKMDYFIVVVINDIGEVWKFSVMKKPDDRLYVRKMEKWKYVYTKDQVDMIFTGNMKGSAIYL